MEKERGRERERERERERIHDSQPRVYRCDLKALRIPHNSLK
jgi:hypothetical protein